MQVPAVILNTVQQTRRIHLFGAGCAGEFEQRTRTAPIASHLTPSRPPKDAVAA